MGDRQRLMEDRAVLITGASSGIGAAAARLFAAEGAAVMLMARRKDRLRELSGEITASGGRAAMVAGDVSSDCDVEDAVAATVETFGGVHGAFNNAASASAGTLIHETEAAVFDRIMEVNVRGLWSCLRHQIPAMLATGPGGAVVNTSSVAGQLATGTNAAYIASKHAVIGLTRAAAAEYGARGIRLNALVVGSTRTEMMDNVLGQSPALEASFVQRSMQKRMASPEEIAQAAVWLCSGRASFVTGAAVAVDGGWTAT